MVEEWGRRVLRPCWRRGRRWVFVAMAEVLEKVGPVVMVESGRKWMLWPWWRRWRRSGRKWVQ